MPPEAGPVLYEVWARPWLRRLGRRFGRPPLTLGELPEVAVDDLVGTHVWLMGAWQVGEAGRAFSRRRDYSHALPSGWSEEDVPGSPYAVASYRVAEDLGGEKGLLALRGRLARAGRKLILDFVPNHTALDHPWVRDHPDRYVQGWPGAEQRAERDYFLADTLYGDRALAHGRDRNPAGGPWRDTAQLDVRRADTRRALAAALTSIADRCDGVRCDMAHLLLRDVFAATWGERPRWPEEDPAPGEAWADVVASVRARHPGFTFIAEVYGDAYADRLLDLGFDYVYDKSFYDAALRGDAAAARALLTRPGDGLKRRLRFLENHDEARAATLAWPHHQAAATLVALAPGALLLHDGQLEGRRVRPDVHAGRWEDEPVQVEAKRLYERLLGLRASPAVRGGRFRVLPGDPGDPLTLRWESLSDALEATVNLGPGLRKGLAPWEVRIAVGHHAGPVARAETPA